MVTRTRAPICQASCAIADGVPAACPIGRSTAGTCGHSRTAQCAAHQRGGRLTRCANRPSKLMFTRRQPSRPEIRANLEDLRHGCARLLICGSIQVSRILVLCLGIVTGNGKALWRILIDSRAFQAQFLSGRYVEFNQPYVDIFLSLPEITSTALSRPPLPVTTVYKPPSGFLCRHRL
jgi:hypothetical protein